MKNVLVCCHCKNSHKSVILLGNKNNSVSYNVFYLDIMCEYDSSQFIGWEDFTQNNNVTYDKIFLLNCPIYPEIRKGRVTSNVLENIMSHHVFDTMKPHCQIIFKLQPELQPQFENGVYTMLDKYNRINDFDVTIKRFKKMDVIALSKEEFLLFDFYKSQYFCVLTKKTNSTRKRTTNTSTSTRVPEVIHKQTKDMLSAYNYNRIMISELINEIFEISIDNEKKHSIFKAINNCFFKVRFAILKFKKNRSFFIEINEDDRNVFVQYILEIVQNSNYMYFYDQLQQEQSSQFHYLLKDYEKVVKHIESLALPFQQISEIV